MMNPEAPTLDWPAAVAPWVEGRGHVLQVPYKAPDRTALAMQTALRQYLPDLSIDVVADMLLIAGPTLFSDVKHLRHEADRAVEAAQTEEGEHRRCEARVIEYLQYLRTGSET
ncbi:MAG: hypothetical protein JWM64_234 [Frankiales bacterium]|nr:hypothetical protein [Frankiales bacterium]